MLNTNPKTNNKEMECKIELEVNSQNVGSIEAEMYNKDFDVFSIIDSFSLAVNAIKDWHLNNPNINSEFDDEKSFIININAETNSISVDIMDADFDSNVLINQIAFAVGYLKGCLCNKEYNEKGGE